MRRTPHPSGDATVNNFGTLERLAQIHRAAAFLREAFGEQGSLREAAESAMTGTHNPILSAGDDDTTRAYLFRARRNRSTYAVTRDPLGSNLPPAEADSWVLDREFALGVREAMPIHVAPEVVLRGLLADGYFVWSEGSNPAGTSQ
jgi:hypothetical protein